MFYIVDSSVGKQTVEVMQVASLLLPTRRYIRHGDVCIIIIVIVCIKLSLYCYVFQSIIYELVQTGMNSMARSYLSQNGRVTTKHKEVCKTTCCELV